MQNTYKAVEVTSPRELNLVTRPVPQPGPGQVRVRVEAAGICHSDVATVEAVFPGIRYPRVPGHEIAGYIEALGENSLARESFLSWRTILRASTWRSQRNK
jgi:alcohol dehydrogenase, propanol-preferring